VRKNERRGIYIYLYIHISLYVYMYIQPERAVEGVLSSRLVTSGVSGADCGN